MKHYLLKINRKPEHGGGSSYLTEHYGWHPDIEPWKLHDRRQAEYLRDILKVEDRFNLLYTGVVEIEEVCAPCPATCSLWQAFAVIALVMSVLALVFAIQ